MRVLIRFSAVLLFAGSLHCGPAPEVELACEDILSAEETRFADVSAFLVGYCGMCHNTVNPVYGYDFSTPKTAYFSASYKPEKIYEQMVTGQMPPGGTLVDDEFLRIFRSWYCRGGLYDAIE